MVLDVVCPSPMGVMFRGTGLLLGAISGNRSRTVPSGSEQSVRPRGTSSLFGARERLISFLANVSFHFR